ncbi:phosphatidate cytidylyltransferase [Wohlfahrtiimonas sp. G9077]|uniref:phosphatidate cytidylyltransferase n=1 Tax=Wohlfahrtiimonas sp. G9077 TaxID=1980118 RepID=UPI000B97EF59|nr:phosphatidate cytidylyltransferase [Wohlfahrtiimonas sp. G9077]OYQ75456.1 phosphatidate cytidylyltransferase [Wohlfahrtiimonas sp. G9077]
MKERVVTGIIMALVALFAIRFLPSWLFQLALLVVVIIGVVEWARMLHEDVRLPYLLINTLLLVIAYIFLVTHSHDLLLTVNAFATYLWLTVPVVLYLQVKYPRDWIVSTRLTAFCSSLMLMGFFVSIGMLHQLPGGYGFGLVLYVIALVALADSGAYFVGRKMGVNKLAPSISPGKTIEGALGGLIFSTVFAILVAISLPESFTGGQKFGFILISMIAAMLSVSGDLYESLIKRHAGYKDSGNLFPGHGGVLDRIDGLIAGATFFAFGFYLFNMNVSTL